MAAGDNKPVGAGKYNPLNSVSTPTQTLSTPPALNANNVSGLNKILQIKIPGITINPAIQYNVIENMSDDDINALGKVLDKMGYSVKNSSRDIKRILTADPVISQIVTANQGKGFFGIRDALLRDYTPVNITAPAENLPARTISKIDPALFGEVINGVFQKVAMKKGTPEQINALVQEFLPQMETGTLTENKKVKNPKTGKLESVTTVTPGMSQAKAELSIEQRIKELYPDEVDRTARINFNSWLGKNTAGA
jgi:hypothetical protein